MTPSKIRLVDSVKAISWNRIENEKDLEVQDRLTGNFWLPKKIPLSNDIPSWSALKPRKQQMTTHVSTGLTLLDTVQGTVGAVSLIPDAVIPHGEVVLTSIAFMELVHTKSYSSIFSTLISTEEIDETFRWPEKNEYPQGKTKVILDYYRGKDTEKRKVASTMLESFLLYSGFYALMYWSMHTKLTSTADLTRLIACDEAVHNYYVGHKYQKALAKASQERRDELQEYIYSLMTDFHDNEELYTESLYDGMGLTENVEMFLRHNADKALGNLRYEALLGSDQTAVNPSVLTAFSPSADENYGFSSGPDSSYVIDTVKATTDDDWDF